MIDTDKYENHTPERWTVDEEDPCRVIDVQDCTIARTDFLDLGGIDDEREWQLTNAQLIADAPLILQAYNEKCKEVERLRLLAENLYGFYVGTYDGSLHLFEQQMDWREEKE